MKRITSLLAILFLAFVGYSQSDMVPRAVISIDEVSLVYIGLPNPISVAVPGYQLDQLELKTDLGELTFKDGHYYLSVPDTRNERNSLTISVFVKNGPELIPAGSKVFKILKVPSPMSAINGYTSGEIPLAKLKDLDLVHVIMECFNYDGFNCSVTSFQLVTQPKDGPAESMSSKGNVLQGLMKQKINELKAGDMIIIANIFADCSLIGNKQMPGSIVLTVVE
ncbi:GldM family protein [Bacteroidota bacterium]